VADKHHDKRGLAVLNHPNFMLNFPTSYSKQYVVSYGEVSCELRAARHSEFDFGAGLPKKDGFSLKKRSDRAQVHLFALSMCQNHVVSDDCCGTPFCTETALVRHRFTSNF